MPRFNFARVYLRQYRFIWFVLVGISIAIAATAVISWQRTLLLPQFFTAANHASDSVTTDSLPETVLAPDRYGVNIQRTMHLLRTSTPKHRNTVRILFYGQSITKQDWWLDVANDFRTQFPNANIIFDNRAIGGFDSSRLVHTATRDITSFYPDLMIFHDYGKHGDYEAIIAAARRKTTTEIVLISDHVTWLPSGTNADDPDALKTYNWHNHHSRQWLPELAQKYGCELIEIRKPWEQYLRQHQLEPKALLAAEPPHLNDRGNVLMATFVKDYFHHIPQRSDHLPDDRVKQYRVGTDAPLRNGKITLTFEGNRVDLVAADGIDDHAGTARILIDGKLPSSFPELYAFTRPSDAIGTEWPAILELASAKPPVSEDWTLVLTDVDADVNHFKFAVFGSQTGFDGTGDGAKKFVSNSGRIVIEPESWWLKTAYQFSKAAPPIGFQIKWRVIPMFTDVYAATKAPDPSREQMTVVAQNLSNTTHTLEILPEANKPLSIKEIRVYHPTA